MQDSNTPSLHPLLSNPLAVCFTGKHERAARLLAEMKRVGINNVHLLWSFPTPYRDFILRRIPHIKDLDSHPGAWGATIANYFAVKTAYELGYAYALIMEDDCRFLKDAGKVSEALDNAPADWDILMLDHFGMSNARGGNGFWKQCDCAWSTACYIVNRRSMERIIAMYESPVSGKYRKPMMRNCDHWQNVKYLGNDMKIYCSVPNLAVQCDCGDSTNYNAEPGLSVQKKFYGQYNLNLNNYQPY